MTSEFQTAFIEWICKFGRTLRFQKSELWVYYHEGIPEQWNLK